MDGGTAGEGRGIGRAWKIGAGVAAAAAGAALVYRARGAAGASVPQSTYPPLDTLKPLAEKVWIVDSGPLVAMGMELPLRMTVVQLENGDVLLHSPTRWTSGLAQALEAIGPIRHLVAPNIAHWTFLEEWQRAFPDATTWSAPGLRERRQVRQSGVRIDRDLADAAPPEWAAEMDQGIVRGGAGFREAYFFHRSSRTLVLVDLIENLQPDKLPPLTRAAMRLAAATDGTTARHLRVILRLGGTTMVSALRRLIAFDPERVVVAHGAILEDRGGDRLRHAFAWVPGIAEAPAGHA